MTSRKSAQFLPRVATVLSAVLLATAFFTGRGDASWTPGCRVADGFSWNFREDILRAMSQTNSATDRLIASTGLVRVPVSQVAYVTDPTTCERAANAYSAALSLPDSTRQVHAVKAGIRFLVIDPSLNEGGYRSGVTFDSSFTQVYKIFAY